MKTKISPKQKSSNGIKRIVTRSILTGKENGTFHPCTCTDYNGGQCYNCLNGAHQWCEAKGKSKCKKGNAKLMGVKLIFK